MGLLKGKKSKAKKAESKGWLKGYDIKWLRDIPEHPEFHLVAEYDALTAKGK